jgi:hypothetical protein
MNNLARTMLGYSPAPEKSASVFSKLQARKMWMVGEADVELRPDSSHFALRCGHYAVLIHNGYFNFPAP